MAMAGNLINAMMGSSKGAYPEVGMGATMLLWSDRHAATIVGVERNGKRVLVKRDKAVRTDSNGQSEAQTYRYERDENAPVEAFTLRKNGRYVEEGAKMGQGQTLAIGYRAEYRDPSF